MQINEQLAAIATLIPVLQEFNATGRARMTQDNYTTLSRVYPAIYGMAPQISCSKCVIEYLNQLLSYYERLAPQYSVTITPEPEKITENSTVIIKKKKCSNCKKK